MPNLPFTGSPGAGLTAATGLAATLPNWGSRSAGRGLLAFSPTAPPAWDAAGVVLAAPPAALAARASGSGTLSDWQAGRMKSSAAPR
jgi:hypothetical protein